MKYNKRFSRILAIVMCVMMLTPTLSFAGTTEQYSKSAQFSSTWGTSNRFATFNYEDNYFAKSSAEYDDNLAIASMALAMAAGSKQDKFITTALKNQIRCTDATSRDYGTDGSYKSIGVAAGKKVINAGTDNEKLLVPVFVRGANYKYEWGQNFIAGLCGNAIGFDWPAKKVCSFIEKYIGDEEREVVIWISGYSRGGAVTNIAAKTLSKKYGKENVYAYCFDSPRAVVKPDESYTNIHCIRNSNDGIAMVLPEFMGFGINGKENFLLYDASHEDVMLKYLAESTKPYYLTNKYKAASGTKWYKFKLNLDLSSVEGLVESVKNLAEGRPFYGFEEGKACLPTDVWGEVLNKLKQVGLTRKSYVKSGAQDSLSAVAVLYESLEDEQIDALKESIKDKKVLIKLVTNLNLVKAVVRIARGKNPNLTKAQYKCIADTIYSALIKDSTFSSTQKKLARKALKGLVKPLLEILAIDYRSDMQVLGTLISNNNLDRMIQSHYYEVNFAWLKARANGYQRPSAS